jgi:type II secretory ATPase GspE/PulE/Tfp pilus assembly ATPase PilB-like protein
MKSLEDVLHDAAATATPQLDEEAWKKLPEPVFGEASRDRISRVVDSGLVVEEEFFQALAKRTGLPWFSDLSTEAAVFAPGALAARLALRHHVIPLRNGEDSLTLACYDPFDHVARSAIRQNIDGKINFVLAPRTLILAGIREHYGVGAETFEELLEGREESGIDADHDQEVNVLDDDDAEASVMKFVNQIIREALRERATDIHVEPLGDELRIRYRIDGVLREVPIPPKIRLLQASVLSRIKIMSNLDIAEKRMPQDGRIALELGGQPIDVRVATIPSVTGETISLRLLGQEIFDFARLGVDTRSEEIIRALIALPNGIVLITGPTGSGKSTSLYTFLSALNTKDRRIVTIEDPVEHKLPGVIQIAVKPEIDLTFARCLRSVLRGDPNVIMVGEMRDFETAEIAIRAALTGHLVFSTLHTNDSVGGITRLIDMGVEPFLVGSSVRAFIAQRLVRRLCQHCRKPDPQSLDFLEREGVQIPEGAVIYGPNGCDRCRKSGYQGRIAIYEICTVSTAMQNLIQHKASASVLRAKAVEESMVPLRLNGWRRVFEGITSVEEVLRVTAADLDVLDE